MERNTESLINEGFACLGMINEAGIKCLILKQRINKKHKEGSFTKPLIDGIRSEISQIEQDISKYSRKLKLIHKKLGNNGTIFDLE